MRISLVWVSELKQIDNFVLAMIMLDFFISIFLMEGKMQWLQAFLTFVSYVFILEGIIKIIAQGFFWHKNSYLRNPWNILDFLVLLNIL